jgi:acid phosphatase family membrane protein YuiD
MNILLSIAIAWIVCQAIKIIHGKKLSAFWKVGGMPSAHSSLAGALATAVALQDGFASTTAAITYVLLAIVIHDALHIRKHHDLKEVSVGLIVGIIVVTVLNYI